MADIYIGTVVSVEDEKNGGRIRVRILPSDKFLKDSELPYAFPLLPKILHVMPKVGEAVCVICQSELNPKKGRFYIGPIISQPQFMYQEDAISATALLDGGVKKPDVSPDTLPEAIGVYPKNDEVAIYGRKNSDIILSDNDIRIRCGARLTDENNPSNVTFNKNAPSYIKLKYYPKPLDKSDNQNKPLIDKLLNDGIENVSLSDSHSKTQSTANIVADKINLISVNGSPCIQTSDIEEGISDEDMQKFIETAHQLPYGDVLVNFLTLFLNMFYSHTHKYHGLPPCPDGASAKFALAYGTTENDIKEKMLSEDIRIN